MKFVKHEQDGDSPITLHSALGPHGEGRHGSVGIIIGASIISSHRVNGSPVYCGGQLQIGLWFTT